VALEDYAWADADLQTGEVIGQVKLACWSRNINVRLLDPAVPKMYIAHRGNATKPQMHEALVERYSWDGTELSHRRGEGDKALTEAIEDINDAYSLALVLAMELRIRAGEVLTKELPHEKEIHCFTRVTKTQPIAIGTRGWDVPWDA
jgi:hypothetical protein